MKQKNKNTSTMASINIYLKKYYPKTHAQILAKSESGVGGLGLSSAKESLKSFDHSFNLVGHKA